uniref:GG17450 n=1 Tax=Drosophila erecta TaxID=7220 RepID=B3P4X8_DROER
MPAPDGCGTRALDMQTHPAAPSSRHGASQGAGQDLNKIVHLDSREREREVGGASSPSTTIATPTGTPPLLPPLPNTFVAIKTKSDCSSSNHSNSNNSNSNNSLTLHSGNNSFKSSGHRKSPQPPPLPMKNGAKQQQQQQQQQESHYQHLSYQQHPGSNTRNTLDRKQANNSGGDYCSQINPHYLQTFDSLDHYSVATMQQQPLRSQSKSQIYSYGSSGTASDNSNHNQQHLPHQQHQHYHSSSNIAHIEHHYHPQHGSDRYSHPHVQQQHQQHQQQQHQHQQHQLQQQQHHSLKHTKHGKGHKNGKHGSKGSSSKSQDDFKVLHKQQQQQQQLQPPKCSGNSKSAKRNGCSNQVLPLPPQQQQHYSSSIIAINCSQARSSGHDELGNLLWQQDSCEFLEHYPSDSSCPVPPLRHCHAPGHGHATKTLSRRNADLFSGDLGIPEINTHVGSVVHTFETLALQRRLAEEEDRHPERELSKYEANGGTTTQSKYSQLKRRSQEMRQRLVQQLHRQRLQQQQLQQQHEPHLQHQQNARSRTQSQPQKQPTMHEGVLTNSCSTQTLASSFWQPSQRVDRSREQLQQSTFEDYRKNLFGTLRRHGSLEDNEELQDESFIVNAAFDEIFSCYDDENEDDKGTQTQTNTDDLFEDEHMLVSLSELDDEVFASRVQTASTTPTASAGMGAGRTPKHSTPQLNLNKYTAPSPPRSRTLTNLFERLKSQDNRTLQKYAADGALNKTEDFNRGSTVSKSFVQQLRKPSHKQKRAPRPPPKPQSRSQVAIAHVTPLRKALIFPKRSKSSSELLLDDLSVQARKYQRRIEQGSAL